MARKINYPTAVQPEVLPGEMGQQIQLQLSLAKLPPIDYKDPEQVEKRITEYFQWCADHDTRPHLEELALALGVVRQTLWKWRKQGGKRGELIDRAVQLLASLHEAWGLSGKLNPATFCFVMKNHFLWQDTINIEAATTTNTPQPEMTTEQIRAAIEENIPIDTDDVEIFDMGE